MRPADDPTSQWGQDFITEERARHQRNSNRLASLRPPHHGYSLLDPDELHISSLTGAERQAVDRLPDDIRDRLDLLTRGAARPTT